MNNVYSDTIGYTCTYVASYGSTHKSTIHINTVQDINMKEGVCHTIVTQGTTYAPYGKEQFSSTINSFINKLRNYLIIRPQLPKVDWSALVKAYF